MIINILSAVKNKFFPNQHQKTLKRWKDANGDESLRLDYTNVEKKSIVFDLGGYKGQWASDIYSKYNCKIYIFEPVKIFYQKIEERFRCNENIKVFNFGLASSNRVEYISLEGDESSIYGGGKKEKINLVNFEEFLKKEKIKNISLMKSNIEGAEYELFEHLIKKEIINKIDNIQIQFHKNIPNYIKRYNQIRTHLKTTHNLKYSFPFVWESWELKKYGK
jgi:FkbM family methyltransferase